MKKPFAKKSFGQNFLADENYVAKIISALNPRKGEQIIEIGAGRGALTEKLIDSGAEITAIELDRDLIPLLREKFDKYENFRLIESDALEVDFKDLCSKGGKLPGEVRRRAKMAANLPYYISTAILQKLIEDRAAFSEMVLMFQKEVVERITAVAGSSERGFLTVLVEAHLTAEKLFDVPPNAFRPAPKVYSSVMRLITQKEGEFELNDEKLFRKIASAAFAQKRKTIQNNLKNAGADLTEKFEKKGGLSKIFEKTEIAPTRRAESLTSAEWRKLTNFVAEK